MLVSTRKPPKKTRDKEYVLNDEFEYIAMPNSSLEDVVKTTLEVGGELMAAADKLERELEARRLK